MRVDVMSQRHCRRRPPSTMHSTGSATVTRVRMRHGRGLSSHRIPAGGRMQVVHGGRVYHGGRDHDEHGRMETPSEAHLMRKAINSH